MVEIDAALAALHRSSPGKSGWFADEIADLQAARRKDIYHNVVLIAPFPYIPTWTLRLIISG
jgi:hypothetical protein